MQADLESALNGITQLAERLGLSQRTIHKILTIGEVPSLQIRRRRLIRLSDLRHWLASHEFPRPSENLPNIARRFSVR